MYGAQATNLIIDARPTTNAMANSVKGAGTENMDHYKNCKKAYLGIDNIHVMRSSLAGIYDGPSALHRLPVSLALILVVQHSPTRRRRATSTGPRSAARTGSST